LVSVARVVGGSPMTGSILGAIAIPSSVRQQIRSDFPRGRRL